MIRIGTIITLAIADIYIFTSFFNGIMRRKTANIWFVLAAFLYTAMLGFLKSWGASTLLVTMFSLFAFFLMTNFFIGNFMQKLFYPLFLMALEIASEIVMGLLFEIVLKQRVNDIFQESNSVAYFTGMICTRLILFLLVRATLQIRISHSEKISFYNWIIVLLVPLVSTCILYALAIISADHSISYSIAPLIMVIVANNVDTTGSAVYHF